MIAKLLVSNVPWEKLLKDLDFDPEFSEPIDNNSWLNEPSHETMVLFILHKLNLQMHMSSHPVGLEVWFLGIMCANSEDWRDCMDAQAGLSLRWSPVW